MGEDATEVLQERARLEVQAKAWSPVLRAWLATLPTPCPGTSCLDVGCGPTGALAELRGWAGASARITGVDIDPRLLPLPGFEDAEVVCDDIRSSRLPAEAFDVVHARFLLSSAGAALSILDALLRLVRAGGLLLVEEPWELEHRTHPPAPAVEQLVSWVRDAVVATGGEPDVGRRLPALFRHHGLEPRARGAILTLPADDPYATYPLAMARALGPRMSTVVPVGTQAAVCARAEHELADPFRWSLSFPIVQASAIKPPARR